MMVADKVFKVLIVEGKTDVQRLQQVLLEEVQFVCTYGTLSDDKMEELIYPLQDEELYILVDADEAGIKLRKQLKQELPNAIHLYTRKMYGEVASTPLEYLARILYQAHFEIKEELLTPHTM
ncbi:toprim domain-containing protein [Caldalkalibacillus horti]|uniref:Toprim domain protein n=1 Tax=Caldalkalibacillus horti TaxID=77523 RepID=A0ABT9W1V4_9BACI|nr:toprim domain-containing protein [Bacillus horti]MDQ0167242.1 toprim domain protein [Bacillus horti]